MAVVLGNLALLLDVTSARTVSTADRKLCPLAIDVVLNLQKRDPTFSHVSLSNKNQLDYWDGENRAHRAVARGKSKAVDFDAESSDDDGNGNGNGFEEEEEYDWENEMRKRVKEIEEMRELEKKAEELQSKAEADESECEDREETEEQKKLRVRKELEKVVQEQGERRATAQLMFELGQKAYGRGMYGRAIEFLEAALTIIPRSTLFGGEIQIWLAMAYEANNRHADCIALYQQLEKNHPSVSIRRQASELRYILQAPKLKITQEEMVTIPLIGSSYDSYAATWTDKNKDRDQKTIGSTTNQLPWSRDFLSDFLVWRPPVGLEKNRAFWVALTVWFGLVGAAVFLQK
ncbi:60S ribosomal protein L27a-3-like [Hibiscus syriacus]|uniref:60S ribosomal protein L27a-3-like n=1 Tax=Hibiscus syriacus TaxID=106335 RepID=A0A6A3B576_HIBSY|nr:uncharacterized protein LOC120117957 [Hibiscus syriacus]KAE8710219.1 60S ribosomal protein L27a-3-like [Hibiscus syriacus]